MRSTLPILAFAAMLMLIARCGNVDRPGTPGQRVNLAHLEALQARTVLGGDTVRVVHIYAEEPDYRPVADPDEGYTCVDDVARAARLYLDRWERTGDRALLAPAGEMLQFVTAMQTPDGASYNFLLPDGTINRTHRNSRALFGWWAARGFRAVARGVRAADGVDPALRAELLGYGARSLARLQELDPYMTETGSELGKDVAAVIVLALLDWRRATGDSAATDPLIDRFAAWIIEGRHSPSKTFPHTVHEPWQNIWHAWGQHQVEALARAGARLDRADWIASAAAEAESWHRRYLIVQPVAYFEFAAGDTVNMRRYSQIAYDLNCIVQGNRALYEVTGDTAFARVAVLAASWFFGNNVTGEPMYDPATGRCFDGIAGPEQINRNSGAESTIEALMALEACEGLPDAAALLDVRRDALREAEGVTMRGPGVEVSIIEGPERGRYNIMTRIHSQR